MSARPSRGSRKEPGGVAGAIWSNKKDLVIQNDYGIDGTHVIFIDDLMMIY